MIINTYGCSWTSGIGLQHGNWPLYCSIKRPDIHWNNYGRAGSSLTWSTFISQLGLNNADINIVQVTTPYRLTTWDKKISTTPDKFFTPCYDKKFENQGLNYTQYRVNSDLNILNTTPGDLKGHKFTNGFRVQEKNFPEMYYNRVNEELQYFEWMKSLHFLIDNVDFVFIYNNLSTKEYKFLDTKNIPCFFESKFFNKYKYVIDTGLHFNSEGNEALADWVLHKIRRLI